MFDAAVEEPTEDEIWCDEEVNVFTDPRKNEGIFVFARNICVIVVFLDVTVVPPEVTLPNPKIGEKIGENFVEFFRFEEGTVTGFVYAGDCYSRVTLGDEE